MTDDITLKVIIKPGPHWEDYDKDDVLNFILHYFDDYLEQDLKENDLEIEVSELHDDKHDS